MEEAVFKLKDKRSLSYALYGSRQHVPVLYFHGTPSSRLEPLLVNQYGIDLEASLQAAGLLLIAVDRPGMGFSTFNPHGNYRSFADDVYQLCQHLQISSCPVLCWSGGGPYALAIASCYPALITSVHIIAGFTRPFDREVSQQMGLNKWYFWAARYVPGLQQLIMNLLRRHTIKRAVPRKFTGLSWEDYRLLNTGPLLNAMAGVSMKQAARLGAKGPVYEARNYFRPFGFSLKQVLQPVHYWWGTKDQVIIRLHPEALEQHLPHPVMHYREGEGHLSIYVNCFHDILGNIRLSLAQ